MADKETIIVNGEAHEIEIKKLNLVFHQDGINVAYPDRAVIDPQVTISEINALPEAVYKQVINHPLFLELFHIVFPKDRKINPVINRENGDLSILHVSGLICLLIETTRLGVPVAIKYPETYLHPSTQVNLADLFIKFIDIYNKHAVAVSVVPTIDPVEY